MGFFSWLRNRRSSKVDFQLLESLDEGRAILENLFPPGTPRTIVEQEMRHAGASCYADSARGLLAVWQGKIRGWILVKWTVRYSFDEHNKLVRMGINRGLVGP